MLYSRRDGAERARHRPRQWRAVRRGDDAGATQRSADGRGGRRRTTGAISRWSPANGQVTLYVDGAVYATLDAALPALARPALIGGDVAGRRRRLPPRRRATASAARPLATAARCGRCRAAPAADASAAAPARCRTAPAATVGFVGDIDELQIAKVARPAGFVKFAAIGQGPEHGKLVSFSVDEETASWFSRLFRGHPEIGDARRLGRHRHPGDHGGDQLDRDDRQARPI